LRELFLGVNEIGEFTLREGHSFPPVPFEKRFLSHRLTVGFRPRLEKHSALAEGAKINDKLMLFGVPVWSDGDCWLFHAEMISYRQLHVNNSYLKAATVTT